MILCRSAGRTFSTEVYLDFGVLQWPKLVKIRKTQYGTKDNPQLKVDSSCADNYSSLQATTAHETVSCSFLGV